MPHPRTVAALRAPVAVTALLLVLAACGSEPAAPGASVSPAPAGSPSAAVSISPPPSATTPESTPAESTPADAVVLDIALTDGTVTPAARKIDVTKGQTVVLNVTSDREDEVHVHGDYDIDVTMTPGASKSESFVADKTGSVEVESHNPEKIIAILNIR